MSGYIRWCAGILQQVCLDGQSRGPRPLRALGYRQFRSNSDDLLPTARLHTACYHRTFPDSGCAPCPLFVGARQIIWEVTLCSSLPSPHARDILLAAKFDLCS